MDPLLELGKALRNNLGSMVKKGEIPNSELEYFLLRALPAYPSKIKDKFIDERTIVINVVDADDRIGYWYTVKNTGEKFHTNYPWALAEYTDENLEKYKVYKEKEKELKKIEKEMKNLKNQIKTLSLK